MAVMAINVAVAMTYSSQYSAFSYETMAWRISKLIGGSPAAYGGEYGSVLCNNLNNRHQPYWAHVI
jgi:hypothetical protein